MTELPMPLCDTKQEISVWTFYGNSYVEEINDLPGVQKMEEDTNVHVNWYTYNLSEVTEKFGLLLASGDMPDLLYAGSAVEYPGGVEKGIEDGMFMDCTELVRKYMPNYRKLRESKERLLKDTMTDMKW